MARVLVVEVSLLVVVIVVGVAIVVVVGMLLGVRVVLGWGCLHWPGDASSSRQWWCKLLGSGTYPLKQCPKVHELSIGSRVQVAVVVVVEVVVVVAPTPILFGFSHHKHHTVIRPAQHQPTVPVQHIKCHLTFKQKYE